MATQDFERIAELKAMQEAHTELLKFIETPEGKKALPNWVFLLKYFHEKNRKIEEQEKELGNYKDFFIKLRSLIPERFSSNTRIE